METLADSLDMDTLGQLQERFAAVAQVPVRILTPEGVALTSDEPPDNEPPATAEGDVPIVVGGKQVAIIRADRSARPECISPEWLDEILHLMADVTAHLATRQGQLRSRVDELATLYRLTAEFTDQRDLQALLDAVARTVVNVLHAKACSIRLLDADRSELVVKAIADLSPEYLDKGPILLSKSVIDQEAFETGRPVYIADEQTDPRVLYSAEAAREGIVSALCAPLMYKGRPEGAIRVYKATKHEFDWFETSLLQAIAAQAAAAIVNARLYQEAVNLANTKRQLRLAAVVQRRMIPAQPPSLDGLDIAAEYVPCFELGGDFYDFLPLPNDNLGLGVCDVVGKGVRASLLMASIRASLRAHADNVYAMSEVMAKVNRDLCADSLSSDFATLFYAVIDARTRRLTYANAGHVHPLLVRDGQVCHLDTGGGVLGIDADAAWEHDSFALKAGDVVLACSDGLTEAMDFRDEQFGTERFEQASLRAVDQQDTADAIIKHVLWEMHRFSGLQESCDDLTLVAVKVI